MLGRNGHSVTILTRRNDVVNSINNTHRNCSYFADVDLPETVRATSDVKEALENCNYILHCVPVQQSYEYIRNIKDHIPPTVPIISTSKGLHMEKLTYMSDIVPDALGRPDQPMAFLSGPSFAKELMASTPTAVVAASTDIKLAEDVQKLFTSTSFRCYTSNDVLGVEVGGALKNVFAIAAGIVDGLGLGMNSMAALVTRGCHEMTRLAVAMGAQPHTLSGLSGIGDLMLTCFGALSRNRSVGQRLGKGEQIADILASMAEVAEGVATTSAAVKLAQRYGLHLPIVNAVAAILEGRAKPSEAVRELMLLPVGKEYDLI